MERGGRIKAIVLPSRRGPALKKQVMQWVMPESIVITDDWPAYHGLDPHFISLSRQKPESFPMHDNRKFPEKTPRLAHAYLDDQVSHC